MPVPVARHGLKWSRMALLAGDARLRGGEFVGTPALVRSPPAEADDLSEPVHPMGNSAKPCRSQAR